MHFPLISIVVCTYNGEQFVEQQIDSLIGQTYPNLEIIISDDNSTDGTKQVLKKYEGTGNIKIIYNKENVGFTRNFAFAAMQASADYIAFSDQDDIWLPQKIEKLYGAIKDYSLVYSNSILVDNNGVSLNKRLSDFRKMKDIITDSRSFTFHIVVSGHTLIIKKELL